MIMVYQPISIYLLDNIYCLASQFGDISLFPTPPVYYFLHVIWYGIIKVGMLINMSKDMETCDEQKKSIYLTVYGCNLSYI